MTTPISTIVNVAEEAVAEELLPYKELFTSFVPGQDHKAAATSCFCVYSSWPFFAMMNSSASVTNSKAMVPNSIAKASNSIAKATN